MNFSVGQAWFPIGVSQWFGMPRLSATTSPCSDDASTKRHAAIWRTTDSASVVRVSISVRRGSCASACISGDSTSRQCGTNATASVRATGSASKVGGKQPRIAHRHAMAAGPAATPSPARAARRPLPGP